MTKEEFNEYRINTLETKVDLMRVCLVALVKGQMSDSAVLASMVLESEKWSDDAFKFLCDLIPDNEARKEFETRLTQARAKRDGVEAQIGLLAQPMAPSGSGPQDPAG